MSSYYVPSTMVGAGDTSEPDSVPVVREMYMQSVDYNSEWKVFGEVLSIVTCPKEFSKKMDYLTIYLIQQWIFVANF